jgi:hypothetical protein
MYFLLSYFVIPLERVEDPLAYQNCSWKFLFPIPLPLKYITLGPMYLGEHPRPEIN